jgi:hypothetical protein
MTIGWTGPRLTRRSPAMWPTSGMRVSMLPKWPRACAPAISRSAHRLSGRSNTSAFRVATEGDRAIAWNCRSLTLHTSRKAGKSCVFDRPTHEGSRDRTRTRRESCRCCGSGSTNDRGRRSDPPTIICRSRCGPRFSFIHNGEFMSLRSEALMPACPGGIARSSIRVASAWNSGRIRWLRRCRFPDATVMPGVR